MVLRVTYSHPNQMSGILPSLQEKPVGTVLLQLCSAESPQTLSPSTGDSMGEVVAVLTPLASHPCGILSFGAVPCGSQRLLSSCRKGPGWLPQGADQEYTNINQCWAGRWVSSEFMALPLYWRGSCAEPFCWRYLSKCKSTSFKKE